MDPDCMPDNISAEELLLIPWLKKCPGSISSDCAMGRNGAWTCLIRHLGAESHELSSASPHETSGKAMIKRRGIVYLSNWSSSDHAPSCIMILPLSYSQINNPIHFASAFNTCHHHGRHQLLSAPHRGVHLRQQTTTPSFRRQLCRWLPPVHVRHPPHSS